MSSGTVSNKADGSIKNPFPIKKGRTWTVVATFTKLKQPVDLDNPTRTGRAHLRRLTTDLGTPLATLVVVKRNQVTERGKADATLGATVSATGAAPDITPGSYVVDIEFEADGDPDDVIATDLIYVEVTGEATHG